MTGAIAFLRWVSSLAIAGLVLLALYEKPCQQTFPTNFVFEPPLEVLSPQIDKSDDHESPCLKEFHRITSDRNELNATGNDVRVPGLTEEDFERSVAHVGNRFRLAHFVDKLVQSSSGKRNGISEDAKSDPVTVVVCGGSISLGHGVEPRTARYSELLEGWLNLAYPISTNSEPSENDSKHRVYNRGSHGADICAMAKRMNYLNVPTTPDLFILEFGVNDYQGQDHIVHLDHKTDVFFDGFQNLAACAETVVYRILTEYPEAAVLFLEFRTGVPHRKTAQLLHTGVAQHYQVPVISYADAIFPDYFRLLDRLKPYTYHAPKATIHQLNSDFPYPHGCAPCRLGDITEQFRGHGCLTLCDLMKWSHILPWEVKCDKIPEDMLPCHVPFFAHDEVHPSVTGHRMARDLIANMISHVALDLCQGRVFTPHLMPVHGGWVTAASRSDVSYGAELRARSDFILVQDTMSIFSDADALTSEDHSEGFELKIDRLGRWGWMATNPEGNEYVNFSFDLPPSQCYAVFLSVLKSYETVGRFTVMVEDVKTNTTTVPVEIDCLWDPRISIPVDIQLTRDDEAECTGSCKVLLSTLPEVEGRGGNLIKFVSLSVRRCIESFPSNA